MENFTQIPGQDDRELHSRKFTGSTNIIPVAKEELHITKQVVETGKVHISKKVIEEQYKTEIPVFKEEIVVEKIPINKYIDGDLPGIRLVDNTTIVPVIKEVIVKRLLLVEELHITKRRHEESVPVHETIRHEEVTVKRNGAPTENGAG